MNSQEGCRFCEIVAEQHDAHIVYADDIAVAFLDHAPLAPGHCLLVTRMHFDNLLDLPPAVAGGILARTQILSRAVMAAQNAEGALLVANTIVQQTVPHFHMHIVPRWQDDPISGFTGSGWGSAELSQVAEDIRVALRRS